MDQRTALRRQLREQRQELAPGQRHTHSLAALHALTRLRPVATATCLGVYLPMASEVDTWPLIDWALMRGVQVVVPVVRRRQMHFHHLGDPLVRTPLGTHQPATTPRVFRGQIDVLVMPLLGFDNAGNRLGMGGGFYDRYLAAASRRRLPRPRRIGLAFECQHLDAVPAEPWDVRLHAVATEQGVRHFE